MDDLHSALLDHLARTASGDPWYGSSIAEVLEGLTAAEAAARPLPTAHTIWELVLHLTSWIREVERRLREGDWRMPADGDWPEPPAATAENWTRAVAGLLDAHARLAETLARFPPARLDDLIGTERSPELGSGVPYSTMLLGLLQHDTYHLGQIGLLRKAAREK